MNITVYTTEQLITLFIKFIYIRVYLHDPDHRCSVQLLSLYCVRSINRIPR